MQPVVALNEIFTRARKFCLDLALNTRILNDVEVALERTTNSLRLIFISDLFDSTFPGFSRSFQGMTDLMQHKHVIQGLGHFLPHRKRQHTILDIEIRRLDRFMLDHDILSSQQLSQLVERASRRYELFISHVNSPLSFSNDSWLARSCQERIYHRSLAQSVSL